MNNIFEKFEVINEHNLEAITGGVKDWGMCVLGTAGGAISVGAGTAGKTISFGPYFSIGSGVLGAIGGAMGGIATSCRD